VRPYTVTIDVEFELPRHGSIAEYREALDDLERLIPRENRDDVVISWGAETSYDNPYPTCSVYYEKAETREEFVARLAKDAESEAASKQEQIAYLKRQLAVLES
jgi:acetoin utilization deacetylase AcuC-like enzyme